MRKLHDIFLRKFILLFTTLFLVLGIIVYIWVKDLYIKQTKTNLLNNIDILSLQINNSKNLDSLVNSIKDNIGIRVTIVNSEGLVVAESHKDKSKMDNHANRKEIIESKYQKYGSIIRHSNTLNKTLLYVSKRYHLDDQTFYIRMASDIETINEDFLLISINVAILFLFFLILAFYTALKISKDVEVETNDILEFLTNLTKQKRANRIDSDYSIEFNNVTKLLTIVSEKLSKKDKQKTKYTTKLRLANKQKDDIISAISHEFKNPIAVISGYTQTLLEDKYIHENIRHKFLEKISSNTNKVTNMIDRLRLSIKLEEGKQELSLKQCNITELVKNIADDLKVTYPNRNIIVSDKELILNIDETLINIAISNLIENALKYSSEDIEIRITNKDISVIDKGIGINEEELAKVTSKFYRVSNNTWNNSLGIGLSLVLNILNFHNYKLEIKSVENEGSEFIIKI